MDTGRERHHLRPARFAIVVMAVVMLTGCSGAAGIAASGGDGTPSGSSPPIHLTALPGRLVFDNTHDIWSVNADGTGLRRLTHAPWREFDPSWSPDGRLIAYRAEPHGHPQVWVMNADGSGQRRLTRDGGFPAWSPDGSMIAYATAGGPFGRSSIALMTADGSRRRLVPHTKYGEYPSWSPDGQRIAFNSNVSGQGLMYIVDLGTSRLVDLSAAGQGHEVAWSPDGRSILFASDRDHPDNYNDIYEMHPDGSGVRRLTHVRAEAPAWSPDGRYIAFSAPGGLGVMRADGSGVTFLPITGVGETASPDWR